MRIFVIVMITILTIAIGINYTWYTWFDFHFLRIGEGILAHALHFWGYLSIIIGVGLLVTIILRKFINIVIMEKQWSFLVSIVFVMQLPVASLWYMSFMLNGFHAIYGIALHTLLILLIAIDYMTAHKKRLSP